MTTHDYSKPTWGHDFTIMKSEDDGKRLSLMGHGCSHVDCNPASTLTERQARFMATPRCRIAPGDFLILKNGTDTTRYQVETVEYDRDPRDLWSIVAAFAPREQAS